MDDLKALELRIAALEKSLKDSLKLFGSSYSLIGDSNSDFLIKTRGKVKIQWGNKFIDLLKDGKLNVESKVIFKESKVGAKDGIYILDDSSITLKIGSTEIPLTSDTGTTYVSFMEEQNTTSDLKSIALHNIGFLYESLDDIDSSVILNGIVYIQSENTLYQIINGQVKKFEADFPTKIEHPFIILNAQDSNYALLISGTGKSNSLSFDNMCLYSLKDSNNLDFNQEFNINSNNANIIKITPDNTIITNSLSILELNSYGTDGGFKLSMVDGKSVLEIDLLIVRDQESVEDTQQDYPEYWLNNYYIQNLYDVAVPSERVEEDPSDLEIAFNNGLITAESKCYRVLLSSNYKGNILDYVVIYNSDLEKILGKVISISDNEIYIEVPAETEDSIGLDISTGILFVIISDTLPIKIQDNTVSIVKYTINNWELSEEIVAIILDGIILANIMLTKSPDLEDKSERVPTTEWVKNLIAQLLPKGSIIMWNGTEVPEGWAICDGTNGTPNLIDCFIKGSNTPGLTGGNRTITLTEDLLPKHSHKISKTWYGESDNANDRNVLVYGDSIPSGEIQATTESAGNSLPINIEPQYYTLMYIIKLI